MKHRITPERAALPFLALPLLIMGFMLAASHTRLSASDEERQSEVCTDCHEDQFDSLVSSPHRILPDFDGNVACTDCHRGDAAHWDDDPDENPMPHLVTLRPLTLQRICASCHQNSHQQNMAEGNAHASADVNCTACHKIHGETRAGLLRDDQPELCLDCHTDVRGDFARPYRHPVGDQIVNCSDCHMPLDADQNPMTFQGSSAACYRCHPQFQGPYPFEHQATVDYSTEEGGCLQCHEPHGGHLPRLLKQPYEGPNFPLCSQCHSVPGHRFNSNHGAQWAGVPCNDCHVDIHGSYESRRFFDRTLQAQGCFNAGCHKF